MKKYIKCNVLCIERTLLLTFTFLLFTFDFLVPGFNFSPFTSHFCFARGYVYWQENGIELNPWSVSDIISDGKGGAIIFTGDGDSIFAGRVDGAGNLLWGYPGIVVDNSGFWQYGIKAVSDGKGGAIVSWIRNISPITIGDIWCQRIDSLGNVMWGMGGVPICTADSGQGAQAIISDSAGGAIIAWVDSRNGNRKIYVQRVDSAGNVKWLLNGVLVASNVNSAPPSIVSDNSEGIILSWSELRSDDYNIYAQRLDSAGAKMWEPSDVTVCVADSGQYLYGSGIASDLSGGAITAWTDKRSGNYDVYAQKVDSTGTIKWSLNGIPICTLSGDQLEPVSVITDNSGGGVILWGDGVYPLSYDIYAQRVDSAGIIHWFPNGVPICTADSIQQNSVMVSDGSSGAIIAWEDKRNYTASRWDIYAQHIDSSGTVLWETNGMAVCTAGPGPQRWSAVTTDGVGGAIIGWTDWRSTGWPTWRGYAQRVNDVPPGIAEEKKDTGCRMQDTRYVLDVYPNPFQQTLSIKYSVGHSEKCLKLKIYSVSGRLVKTLVNEVKAPGVYVVYWDGNNRTGIKVSSGIYFCILETEKYNFMKKILFMKYKEKKWPR